MKDDQPQRIFKYRSLSGQFGRDAVENVFIHNRLYWQSPTEFNDPFDCDPIFYFGDTKKERETYLKSDLKKNLPGSRSERNFQITKALKRPSEYQAQAINDDWPKKMAQTAVSCFTLDNDNLLMWAHYADSHRGVCLIFDESIEDDFFALPIDYQTVRPKINICTIDKIDLMKSTLLTKSEHWSYENELRMIAYRRGRGFREFPAAGLVGIVLGARISVEDEAFVRKLATKRTRCEIYRASIDRNKFQLNILAA